MNAEQLLTHFDRIVNAPDAIPRLRRFILDLAVRGKLVEQDPKEGTGSSLLSKIEQGQAAHISSREFKKTYKLGVPSLSDVPFQVPENWALVRLGQALELVNGRAFKPSDWTQIGLPIVRIQNLNNPSATFNRYDGEVKEKFLIDNGDFLISWSGTPGTSFGAHIWMGGPAVLNQHIFKAIPIGDAFEPYFLKLAINARLLELIEQAHGGVGLQHITKPKLEAVVLTLPPLAEQHRIVAKVDELMALCDRLEATRTERENTRNRVTAASLSRLNAPDPDPAVFQNHAAFALDNFPPLTTRPEQIKALRQTILNLAVRGKLVDQESSEGGVDDLLEEFGIQQKRLIAEKKLKHSVSTCNLEIQDNLASIPNSWCWVPLGKLISFGPQNGVSPRATNSTDAPKAITLTATTSGAFDASHFKHVEADVPTDSEYWLRDGDLLFQRGNTREYVGIAAYFSGASGVFLYPDLIMKVRLLDGLSLPYVHLALVSPGARTYFSTKATGTQETMPKINQQTLLNAPVPLPPLAEQHRIVAKVDELMALCDRLEANLARGDETRGRLVDTLLHEALEPATGGEVTARPNPRL